MEKLEIKWRRLVFENETCSRCGETGNQVEKAVGILKKILKPLGIEVFLVKEKIYKSEFEANPTDSNRIFLNGVGLEEWLDAKAQSSLCCDVCGENQCRTLVYNDKEYETVPAKLIIKAGLYAAAELIEPDSDGGCCSENKTENECCRSEN